MSVSVSDQSVGTPQIQVTDSSVGEPSVFVRDQSVGTPQIQVTDSSVGESSVSIRDQSVGTSQIQVTDRSVSVRDQSVGTPQIQVTDRSVGECSVSVREQGTSASTCCGAGIPRFLLSLPSTSGPQSEVIIEEELNFPYVKAVLKKNAVGQERVEAAIRYLNTREGGKSCKQAGISWVEDEKAYVVVSRFIHKMVVCCNCKLFKADTFFVFTRNPSSQIC